MFMLMTRPQQHYTALSLDVVGL